MEKRFIRAGAATFFYNFLMRILHHVLEVFSHCPQPTDQRKQSDIEDVAWTRLTSREQIHSLYKLLECVKFNCVFQPRTTRFNFV